MRGRTLKRHKQHSNHVQHIVHADGKLASQHSPATTNKPATTYQKNLLIALTIIFILVAVVTILRLNVRNGLQQNPTTSQLGANSQLILESLAQLDAQAPSGLAAAVDKINAVQGSDSDPSLLYIKLRYYIYISDTANARKTYNALVNVYDAKVGYDPTIGQSARSMDGLKADVEFLEQQSQQLKKNAWGTAQ